MAYIKLLYACAILLVISACHEILWTEGRQLKAMGKEEQRKTEMHGSQDINSNQNQEGHHLQNNFPTRLGNAASINHVVNVAGEKYIHPIVILDKSSGFDNTFAANKDDFRPTAPGSSPGVGHSFAGQEDKTQRKGSGVSQFMAGSIRDFQPTIQGHSPGIGHLPKAQMQKEIP
ncbi:precursor of CEP9-like [Diospyros lotus]|uniref:precursor of CEP9-like n=1 Tax=Diospyros lotus TaxID=55363 RepID=UPI002258DDE2|nr:precursor of CEP9-like [Diospyros lotus]